MIICPPPEPRKPMSERARTAADYLLAQAAKGRFEMEDVLAFAAVRRRLRELEGIR